MDPIRFVVSPAVHSRMNQKDRALSAFPLLQFVISCLGGEGGEERGGGGMEGGGEGERKGGGRGVGGFSSPSVAINFCILVKYLAT